MTEKEKMLAGKLYDSGDEELVQMRAEAHRLSLLYNRTHDAQEKERAALLDALLPNRGSDAYLQGPIQFDYGAFTTIGKNFYANFNFTVLDCGPVFIGDNVFFGPNCTIATPVHPMLPQERRLRFHEDGSSYDLEYAASIVIENNCWIASGVTICAGVTIGEGSVIGAGSVVTRSIPPHSFAAGVPCRVIRPITEQDSLKNRPELVGDHTEI